MEIVPHGTYKPRFKPETFQSKSNPLSTDLPGIPQKGINKNVSFFSHWNLLPSFYISVLADVIISNQCEYQNKTLLCEKKKKKKIKKANLIISVFWCTEELTDFVVKGTLHFSPPPPPSLKIRHCKSYLGYKEWSEQFNPNQLKIS